MSVPDVLGNPPFTVSAGVCRDFSRSSRLEWLETNHTGAFAMGTVAGVATRRYHGLLIASLHPPADRFSIVPRLEEQALVAGQAFSLATVQYPGFLQPHGFELLDEFALDPFPTWRYRCGQASIRKTVCLLDRQQSVLIGYETSTACRLSIRVFVSFRDYHGLLHQDASYNPAVAQRIGSIAISARQNFPPLIILQNGEFAADGIWYQDHEYLCELERGLDFREDLFSPGVLHFNLTPDQPFFLIATLEPQRLPPAIRPAEIESILDAERRRREFSVATPAGSKPIRATLVRALDQFRVTRFNGRPSLIAGYPWFTDWSRDTLIGLPALCIAGFPRQEIKEILEMLVNERSHGILPNRFSDTHALPEYNTADATLWFFVAAHHFLDEENDLDFLRTVLYPAATDILDWHRRGTDYNIHVDPQDHLLWAGDPGTQLTWMDANAGGLPVTPRYGKPVEINALWYNALRIVARWSALLGSGLEDTLHAEAEAMLSSFQNTFWNESRDCLYDVIRPPDNSSSLRPNQLLALALPFPLLDRERARSIVTLIERELLTPVGLRTLEPQDPSYAPRFEGSPAERDRTYHQGTVWPWLLGPFASAYLYAHNESEEALEFCRQLADRLSKELTACCLGSLSEVYDGDPPHRPAGAPAQLWSVAQLLLTNNRLYESH